MSPLVRDVVLYNAKLWVASLAGALFVPLSLAALALDLVFGTTSQDDSLARRVLRTSAQLEASLDVHGELTDVSVVETAG
ncbi:hypothetical protein [Rubrivirga sp. IMCC43871]|uniref:hypothetical protein n=1 Tax=Rubrivirga sp. IMCC43871 TaxID=3391575 RepID=UPI0039903427